MTTASERSARRFSLWIRWNVTAFGMCALVQLGCTADTSSEDDIASTTAELVDACATGLCGKFAYPSPFTGRLVYTPDAQGDRIPDFGGVGYENGAPLPSVPTRLNYASPGGVDPNNPCADPTKDRTAQIQDALAYVASFPAGTSGAPPNFHGALTLYPGYFPIWGTLSIPSGVVLQGAGDDDGTGGTTLGTVLFWCAPLVITHNGDDTRGLVQISDGSAGTLGTAVNIIDDVVPAGATSFRVDAPGALSVGSDVNINRAPTAQWLAALHMDNETTMPGETWTVSNGKLDWVRRITRIEGTRIFINEPLTNAIEKRVNIATPPAVDYKLYSSGTVAISSNRSPTHHAAVKDVRAVDYTAFAHDRDYDEVSNPNHLRRKFVYVETAEDIYVSNVSSVHFGYGVVTLGPYSRRVTVTSAAYLSPAGPEIPTWRYSFANDGQLSLVQACYSEDARHDFVLNGGVSNGSPVGPNVFYDSVSYSGSDAIGPHQRWGTGSLFDNIRSDGAQQGGYYEAAFAGNVNGTGHGWRAANIVFWGSTGATFRAQNPPTAQNWVVGGSDVLQITNNQWNYNAFGFAAPYDTAPEPAYSERLTQAVAPASLYVAQANERMLIGFTWDGPSGGLWSVNQNWAERVAPSPRTIQTREYLVGDIDNFTFDGADPDDAPYVDPAFVTYVSTTYPGSRVGFDTPYAERRAVFTIEHQLDAGDKVIHGTLALSLKARSSSTSTDFIEIWGDTGPRTLQSLGWLPLGPHDIGNNKPVRVLDLGDRLGLVNTGKVSVVVADDSAIDFALLTLTVAVPAVGIQPTVTIPQAMDVLHDVSTPPITLNTYGTVRVQPSTLLQAGNVHVYYSGALRMEGGTANIQVLTQDGPIYVPAVGGGVSAPAPIAMTAGGSVTFNAGASLVVRATDTLVANQVVNVVSSATALNVVGALPPAYCYDSGPTWRYVPCRTEKVGNLIRVVVAPRLAALQYNELVLLRAEATGNYLAAAGSTLSAATASFLGSSQWRLEYVGPAPTPSEVVPSFVAEVALRNVITGTYLAESGANATLVSSVSSAAKWRLMEDDLDGVVHTNVAVVPGAKRYRLQAVLTGDHLKATSPTTIQVLSGGGSYARWRLYDAPTVTP